MSNPVTLLIGTAGSESTFTVVVSSGGVVPIRNAIVSPSSYAVIVLPAALVSVIVFFVPPTLSR